jgi:choline dehydrogenase-like flavoprotein
MGKSRATGVVDGELRAFSVPNLTVVSTSSFPTGGGANPTFMLMAFALRAANRIARDLRRVARTGDQQRQIR